MDEWPVIGLLVGDVLLALWVFAKQEEFTIFTHCGWSIISLLEVSELIAVHLLGSDCVVDVGFYFCLELLLGKCDRGQHRAAWVLVASDQYGRHKEVHATLCRLERTLGLNMYLNHCQRHVNGQNSCPMLRILYCL